MRRELSGKLGIIKLNGLYQLAVTGCFALGPAVAWGEAVEDAANSGYSTGAFVADRAAAASDPDVTVAEYNQGEPSADSEEEALKITAFPIIGYTPETDWAFSGYGVLSFPSGGGEELSSVQLYAVYTLRKQTLVGSGIEHYIPNGDWVIRSDINFKIWEEDFYGLGSATADEEQFTYQQDSLSASFEALRRLGDSPVRLGFNVKGKWLYQRDWDLLLETDPRIQGEERSVRASVGLRGEFDTRDSNFSPTEGYYGIAEARLFPNIDSSDGPFGRFMLDARGYFDLGKTHVIAVRGTSIVVTDCAPLSELVAVGGSNKRLKGLPENLARNTGMALAQIEYRTPYVWRFGFVAAAGIGHQFGLYGRTGCCTPLAVLGGGVRFALQQERRINLTADVGWSATKFDFYIGIGETF